MDLILALLNVGGETIGLGVDPLRKAYIKLVGALWVLTGIMLFGLGCNIFGYPEVNIILSSLFAVVTAILWWRPQQVAEVSIVGAIVGNGSLSEGAKWLLGHYYSVFKTVLLVGTTVLFYLGFIPFSTNPGAFFVLIAGTIALSLMADQWKYGGEIGKKIVFYGACVIVGFAVISLIPQEFWGKSDSFFGEWAASIKTKKGGVFVLALLLSVIFTLFDERSNTKKESKGGYTIILLILFGLTSAMFTPPALDRMWKEYEPGGTQDTQPAGVYGPTTKHGGLKSIKNTTPQSIVIRPGVFERVSFPSNASLIENFTIQCPQGCLTAIEHSITEGEPQVCPGDGMFNGEKCWVERSVPGVNRGEYRVREIFTVPADGSINLPHDLRAFILWVSSSSDTQSTATVTITWSR